MKALNECMMAHGTSVSAHVLKMKAHLNQLERLGAPLSKELAIDTILGSLPRSYDQFVMNYNMHNMDKSITELLGMLKNVKKSIPKSNDVLVVQKGKGKHQRKAKLKTFDKGKGKSKPKCFKPKLKVTKEEGVCLHCNEPGHWKRNCKLYLKELKKKGSATSTSGIFVIEINMDI